MLQSCLNNKKAIRCYLVQYEKDNLSLTELEWSKVEAVKDVLKIFYDTTVRMSARRESCSQIIPRVLALMNCINDMLSKEKKPKEKELIKFDNLRTFGKCLQNQMKHYFLRYLECEVRAVATFMDPR